jgi:2-dehydropantoate 2-reductase
MLPVFNTAEPAVGVSETSWHVLGAGAMGCVFATYLQRGGNMVTLLLRDPPPASSLALEVSGDDGINAVAFAASHAQDDGPIGKLLVTTKAYDVCTAVHSVAHRFSADTQVLLLANGLGFAAELKAQLPHLDCYLGTTTEGAFRVGTRQIHHAGRGLTRIGKPGQAAPPNWLGQWQSSVPGCSWDSDIEHALWLKLALNCAINPVTAVYRCRNGELLQPAIADEVSALCAEIAAVSRAAGYAAITADLQLQVNEVIRATAKNRSSMLQDMLAGRRTEIDYITGKLLSVAREHGVAAPHNEKWMQRVLALEH